MTTLRVDEIRHAHYLRRGHDTGIPGRVICLVTERCHADHQRDDDSRPCALTSWSACCWDTGDVAGLERDRGRGEYAADCWRWLRAHYVPWRATWVFALGMTDALTELGFWARIEAGEYCLDGCDPYARGQDHYRRGADWLGLCVVDNPPTVILTRLAQSRSMIRWVDARNYGVHTWDDLPRAETRVEQLRLFVCALIGTVMTLRLGGLRGTAGAQAWAGWRRSYMDHTVLIHASEDAIRLERAAYYAGRNECYRIGRCAGPIYHLDAQSLYPAVARGAELPTRLGGVSAGGLEVYQERTAAGWQCVAEVDLDTDTPVYPLREEQETIYPVGRFRTTLCGPELDHALSHSHVARIGACAWYAPAELLTTWVDSLWTARCAARERGDVGMDTVIKRLMNSLIGKFAAHSWRWVDWPTWDQLFPFDSWVGPHPGTGEAVKWRAVCQHTQYEEYTGEHPESAPVVAAWITALARLRLWRWLGIAGHDQVYYVDTDSLWLSEVGYQRLRAAGEVREATLGSLSVRGVYPWLDVRGLKHYSYPGCDVAAGVPLTARERTVGGWAYWSLESPLEAVQGRHTPGLQEIRRVLHYQREYSHGIVSRDGNVTPLRRTER